MPVPCRRCSVRHCCPRCSFHGFGRRFACIAIPGLVPYNDEAGELFHLPLFTGLALLAYGLRLRFRFTEQESCQGYVIPVLGSTRLRRRLVTLLLMWTPVVLMVTPVSNEFSGWVRSGSWAVSALAGIGAGIAGCRIGLALCRFSGGQLVLSLGLASIVAPICNYLVLLCPEPYWVIPALLFPALFALLPSVYPTASGEEGEHTYPFSRIPLFLWCGCLLTAFSESAYYNLYGALEPVMPGPSLSVLVLVVLGGLSALLVLGQAHRSPIWYAFLLVIPVLVVGYTAWPLLHRESPGLSLGGLLFGYTLLNIYMMTAFLHTVSYRKGTRRLQLLACGIGGIALASWMGSHNSGWITGEHARGDSLNSLFAFQAFAILAGSFIFVVYLEKVGFFPSGEGGGGRSGTGGRAGPEHADVLDGLADRGTGDALPRAGADQAAGDDCRIAGPQDAGYDHLRQPQHFAEHIEDPYTEYSPPPWDQQPPRAGVAGDGKSGGHFRNAGRRPLAVLRSGWRMAGSAVAAREGAVEAEEAFFRERLFCVP